MKPIVCLIVLSLNFAFWSNSFIGSMASETPEGDVALEQPFDKLRPLLQRDQSPGPKWWTWDIWAEWLCPPRRKPRRWRRLSFLLCKLRRRYRQRVQRWRLLRQEWRELMEGVSEYMMRELELTQVQLDEMWTFVRKKERLLNEQEKANSGWGDNWIWIAFDPIHKLVVAMLVGDRTEEEAMGLLSRLRARLAERHLPLFTSDPLPHYAKAILHIFGAWIRPQRKGNRGRFPKPRPVPTEELRYATVHKEREKGRVVSVTTQVVYGCLKDVVACLKPLGQTINTSFVERMNLTLRHLVSRLHRKTLCFSKKREYLEYHLHLSLAYYHFVLYHSSLRVRLPEPIPTRGNGSPKIWEKRTPARAAGLTDHAWSLKELLMCHVSAVAGQTPSQHRTEDKHLTRAGFTYSQRRKKSVLNHLHRPSCCFKYIW